MRSMSRLIIKNLPKNIKEERFRSLFSSKGEITDAKLCFTKDGNFRKFGFIGYKTEKEAKEALQHFHNSFIDTSKVQVEIAKNLGDETVPRPWSKHSEGSSAHEKLKKNLEERSKRKQKLKDIEQGGSGKKIGLQEKESREGKGKKKSTILEEIDDLGKNKEFQEFLNVHQHRSTKKLWSNDSLERGRVDSKEQDDAKGKGKVQRKTDVTFDDSGEDDNDEDIYDATGLLAFEYSHFMSGASLVPREKCLPFKLKNSPLMMSILITPK